VDELKELLKWAERMKAFMQQAPMDWDESRPVCVMLEEAMEKARTRILAGIVDQQSEVCRQALAKIRACGRPT
jgi:hypothetical protein